VVDAQADLVNADADADLGIAALVTMDSDLDTLIAAANSANSSNDATTEIDAIRDAGTGYVANIALVDGHFDNSIADIALAAASLTAGTASAPSGDVVVSYDKTNVTTLAQLREAFGVALSLARAHGLTE
jgi:hypothetical protein